MSLVFRRSALPFGVKPRSRSIVQDTADDSRTSHAGDAVPVPAVGAAVDRHRRRSVKDDAEAVELGSVAKEGDLEVGRIGGG